MKIGYDCERVFVEKVSGVRAPWPKRQKLIDHLRAGDVIVVTCLERLVRDTGDLLDLAGRLNDKRAGLRSLAESWADTTSPTGKTLLSTLAGIAEFDRARIIARAVEGRAAALRRGVKVGPKRKLSTEQIALAAARIENGQTVRDAARALGVHCATLYRALNSKTDL